MRIAAVGYAYSEWYVLILPSNGEATVLNQLARHETLQMSSTTVVDEKPDSDVSGRARAGATSAHVPARTSGGPRVVVFSPSSGRSTRIVESLTSRLPGYLIEAADDEAQAEEFLRAPELRCAVLDLYQSRFFRLARGANTVLSRFQSQARIKVPVFVFSTALTEAQIRRIVNRSHYPEASIVGSSRRVVETVVDSVAKVLNPSPAPAAAVAKPTRVALRPKRPIGTRDHALGGRVRYTYASILDWDAQSRIFRYRISDPRGGLSDPITAPQALLPAELCREIDERTVHDELHGRRVPILVVVSIPEAYKGDTALIQWHEIPARQEGGKMLQTAVIAPVDEELTSRVNARQSARVAVANRKRPSVDQFIQRFERVDESDPEDS